MRFIFIAFILCLFASCGKKEVINWETLAVGTESKPLDNNRL